MSLSNAASDFDTFWEGSFKAEKHSAKSGNTAPLVGWGGNDTLNGADKNDKLEGKDSNDTLIGGSGKDTFEDDDGRNVFTGGKDKDLFVIDDDDGFVRITDFNGKKDKLEIDDDYKFFDDFKKRSSTGRWRSASTESLLLSSMESPS